MSINKNVSTTFVFTNKISKKDLYDSDIFYSQKLKGLLYDYMKFCNCSVGLRIYCADRKKVIQVCRNRFAKQILIDFCIVTMRVLNSYEILNYLM